MRLLLIDNSNTRTKFAIGTPAGLGPHLERVPTKELDPKLITHLNAQFEYDAVVVSSVVPKKAALLREMLSAKPMHFISHQSELPIGIDYPAPEEIGADRLANAVAVHAHSGTPAIVIDFGTAVTFDVVGLPGPTFAPKREAQTGAGEPACYLGGVIAPGLASMTTYLHRRTALLPQIDLAEPKSAIGKSTAEAMRAGAVYGYRGMIREILQRICGELEGDPNIVATGGDAALIAEGLPEVHEIIPNLTLEGIQLIGERNIS